MTQCIAAPLSRSSIRNRANIIRCIASAENDLFFDIVKFVEVTLPSIGPDFNFRVVTEDKLGECHGITYPDKDEIQIRQDVYDRAVDRNTVEAIMKSCKVSKKAALYQMKK